MTLSQQSQVPLSYFFIAMPSVIMLTVVMLSVVAP